MEYQIIPISSLKRIESWLTDETGFSLSMLHSELDYISDVYLLGKQFPVEIQDLYLSIKKEEQDIPYPNRGTDEDKYKFSLTVGKNLVLKSGDFEADYILNLFRGCNVVSKVEIAICLRIFIIDGYNKKNSIKYVLVLFFTS